METIKNYLKGRNKFIDIRRINNVETYKPKANKFKQGFLIGFIGLLFITPCTNWLIIPMTKILTKYPLWIYR